MKDRSGPDAHISCFTKQTQPSQRRLAEFFTRERGTGVATERGSTDDCNRVDLDQHPLDDMIHDDRRARRRFGC